MFTEEDTKTARRIEKEFKDYLEQQINDQEGHILLPIGFDAMVRERFILFKLAKLENENKRLIGIVQNLTSEIVYLRNGQKPSK